MHDIKVLGWPLERCYVDYRAFCVATYWSVLKELTPMSLCAQKVFLYLCKIMVEPLMSHRLFEQCPCYVSMH